MNNVFHNAHAYVLVLNFNCQTLVTKISCIKIFARHDIPILATVIS